MARYIDANEFQKRLEEVIKEPDYQHEGEDWRIGVCLGGTLLDKMPTADVDPRSEVAREILSDLKKQIDDKAIYPGARDAYSFINIKVFDAVLNNILIKYTEGKK